MATFAARARRFNRYSLAERSTRSKPLATRVARRFAAPAFVGVVLVLAAHSTAFVSDASHGSIVRGGYRSGAWIGGIAGVVNAARSRGKGTMGGAAASGCVAALAAFVTIARAPSLSYRGMVGHGLIAPRCFAGEVYTECIARFGAVANPSLPSAVLTVRERAGRALETERGSPSREPPPIEVEWAALAPEDVEIVARVVPSNGAASRGLLVDDGIGGAPRVVVAPRVVRPRQRGSLRRVRRAPTERRCPRTGALAGIRRDVRGARTAARGYVHRQAVNDDGHGLGAARRTLVDESPGALSFLVAGSWRVCTTGGGELEVVQRRLGGDVACELPSGRPWRSCRATSRCSR